MIAARLVAPLALFLPACTLLFDTDSTDDSERSVAFLAVEFQSAVSASSLSYQATTPDAEDRVMLVAVLLGAGCSTVLTPVIQSITYDGRPLRPIASVQGVPCGAAGTRSEQWLLESPPTGRHEVQISLSSPANSIHSNAMILGDVDQAMPVRSFAADTGAGESSRVTLQSAPGDLVVNVVGQGNSILDPGLTETTRFRANIDSSNTLNNSAGSTAPGAPQVESSWTFGRSDQWQSISVSLRTSP